MTSTTFYRSAMQVSECTVNYRASVDTRMFALSPCTHTVFVCVALSLLCKGCVALSLSLGGASSSSVWGLIICVQGFIVISVRGLVICVRVAVICVRGSVVPVCDDNNVDCLHHCRHAGARGPGSCRRGCVPIVIARDTVCVWSLLGSR